MPLTESEKQLFNKLFASAWEPDAHAQLQAMGASDAMIRAIFNNFRQQAQARFESQRDRALARLAELGQ